MGSYAVYMHLEGDAHVPADKRVREWNDKTVWTVMDYKSAEGMMKRVSEVAHQLSIGLSSSVLCYCLSRSLASPWATSLD